MAYRVPTIQKVMLQPINVVFRHLQNQSRVIIWLSEIKHFRISGTILGFDEYMNMVLDGAEEIWINQEKTKKLGKILLKGDTISLIQPESVAMN